MVFTVERVTITELHFTRVNGYLKRQLVEVVIRRDSHAEDVGRKYSIYIQVVRNVRSEPVPMEEESFTADCVQYIRVIE